MRLRSVRGRRVGIAAIVLAGAILTAAVCAGPALADESVSPLTLHVGNFRLDERIVEVVVGEIPSAASWVAIVRDGTEATRVPVPIAEGRLNLPVSVPGDTAKVSVTALDVHGAVIASSERDLVVDSSRFIPAYPRVSLRWDSFVMPSQTIRVQTSDAVSVSAHLGSGGCQSRESREAVSWDLKMPARVPYGHTRLRVYVRNAWGVRKLSVPVWSLKWRPSSQRSILVDKSDFLLYYAQKGIMRRVYPVAIGMPGTPTHVGQFWLGSPRSAGGPWGVIRMALSKRKGTGPLPAWGGYYIHGTNQPDSIGTQASHGCVRMFNSGVLNLAGHTRHWLTRVTIRP